MGELAREDERTFLRGPSELPRDNANLSHTYRRRVRRKVNVERREIVPAIPFLSDAVLRKVRRPSCRGMHVLFVYRVYAFVCMRICLHVLARVRWSRSPIGGWKARGKDIKRGSRDSTTTTTTTTMTTIARRKIRVDRPRSRRPNYRSSPIQSLAAHAGSGVSYSHPGPQ